MYNLIYFGEITTYQRKEQNYILNITDNVKEKHKKNIKV
jgi:hypothetical protein